MADYRIVLAQLPTPRAATQAAQTLAAAFARHLAAIRKTRRYRGELTEPLHRLAQDEGFEWAAEDRFAWDASDDDPSFVIGSAGHLLVAYHAAAMQLAEVGLQAFARARGANATTFWDPDPTPGTLTIKAARAAGLAEAVDVPEVPAPVPGALEPVIDRQIAEVAPRAAAAGRRVHSRAVAGAGEPRLE